MQQIIDTFISSLPKPLSLVESTPLIISFLEEHTGAKYNPNLRPTEYIEKHPELSGVTPTDKFLELIIDKGANPLETALSKWLLITMAKLQDQKAQEFYLPTVRASGWQWDTKMLWR